jgi:hypothetical protein
MSGFSFRLLIPELTPPRRGKGQKPPVPRRGNLDLYFISCFQESLVLIFLFYYEIALMFFLAYPLRPGEIGIAIVDRKIVFAWE